MKPMIRTIALATTVWLWVASASAAAAPVAAMTMPAKTAAAQPATAAAVRIDHAWVRAAPPGTDMLAGYMDIHNVGPKAVRLVAADCDAFAMVELHRSSIVKGVSTMTPAGAQAIAPGDVLAIQAGGLHFMLMQPLRPLQAGQTVRFTLHFADGSRAGVEAVVRTQAPTASGR